jgi:hypothetical protein
MPLSVGDWIVLEQSLTEVTVHHEHFPDCLRHQGSHDKRMGEIWDQLSLKSRIAVAAGYLLGNQTKPAVAIRRAYIMMCREN